MDKHILVGCESKELSFSYYHIKSYSKNKDSDPPHTHKDLLEIFLLLDGDMDYVIDGKQFHVNPYDMVVVSNEETHRSIKNSDSEYILLSVNLDFFVKNDCSDFTSMIFNREIGTYNKIDSSAVVKEGLFDIYTRLERYASEKPASLTVVKSIIIELLYNINKQLVKSADTNYSQKTIKRYMQYINDNITSELTLDSIADHFFITKQHLCKIFKHYTGFTIKKYIAHKRIILVRELYSSGMSITEACLSVGFNSYSSFYRTFQSIMHEPPRKNLSNIKIQFEDSDSINSSQFFEPEEF